MFVAACIHLSGKGNLGLEFFFSTRFSLVEQQYASKAGTAIAGKQQCLFLPAVVRPILDSFEASKQVPQPALSDVSVT
ncbi:hypothetical protein DVH24_011918 [Malus domestica]|uniref:Uncharacterized protein n=1 Tax=Malus domestica TaxID=3750 RepID=A0A498JFS3_MALDO|nr:hypothetical protein DVH24_011918 [Malus domestica]